MNAQTTFSSRALCVPPLFVVTHKSWEKNLLIKYLCPRDFRRGEMEENMFKKMRRFKQQISKDKCVEILTNEPHGVLSLISDTGYPYGRRRTLQR